jgi:hypothetical protein
VVVVEATDLATVLRLNPSSRATRRMLRPSFSTLCRSTCT